MHGHLAIVLHAHLPFVRHPEHERFFEESWLFEAITETYLPLLKFLRDWQREELSAPITFTLSPTLCEMLRDPLLMRRYRRHLDALVELSGREIDRSILDPRINALARIYRQRFESLVQLHDEIEGDLVREFRRLQDGGRIEIIACAATHAVLPLLADHPPSLRAQIMIGRDQYRHCFGRDPSGIWLPECAYAPGVDAILREANIRWFILDRHGIEFANPRPRYGVHAPLFSPRGVAAFGRDSQSARQVWSRNEGYPGDPRYRDFYRDIGFDLDFEHVRSCLPSPIARGFTGIKYHRITGPGRNKELYDREAALRVARGHARHFARSRVQQSGTLAAAMSRPPIIVCPYDAELFGHWWFEGPEFLDFLIRETSGKDSLRLTTPSRFLRDNATAQIAEPASSTWGSEGHLQVWLDESNQWIQPHLRHCRRRMTELVKRHTHPNPLQDRALRQAGRELLLAEASDWPFLLHTGTSPDYARRRVTEHVQRFSKLDEQLSNGSVDETWLAELETQDNLFAELDYRYWR